jgi:hypothetical protein
MVIELWKDNRDIAEVLWGYLPESIFKDRGKHDIFAEKRSKSKLKDSDLSFKPFFVTPMSKSKLTVSNIDLEVYVNSNVDGVNTSISLSLLNGQFIYPEAFTENHRNSILWKNWYQSNRSSFRNRGSYRTLIRSVSQPVIMHFEDDSKPEISIKEKRHPKKLSLSLGDRKSNIKESISLNKDPGSNAHHRHFSRESKAAGANSNKVKHKQIGETSFSPKHSSYSLSTPNISFYNLGSEATMVDNRRIELSKLVESNISSSFKPLNKIDRLSIRTSGRKSSKSFDALSHKPMSELISDFEERMMVAILEAISDEDNVCRSFKENSESRNDCVERSNSETSIPWAQETSKMMMSKMTMLLRPRASPLTCEALFSSTQQTESYDDDDIGFCDKDKSNYGHPDQAYVGALPDLDSSVTPDIFQRFSVSTRY